MMACTRLPYLLAAAAVAALLPAPCAAASVPARARVEALEPLESAAAEPNPPAWPE